MKKKTITTIYGLMLLGIVIIGIALVFTWLSSGGTSEFYQHPMGVVVVADSEEICDRALRLIKIEWEERPFILEMEEALKEVGIHRGTVK